jgi:hypothetical protein
MTTTAPDLTAEQRERILGMFTGDTVKLHAAIAREQILDDIAAGVVPDTVTCFADLHDHVDANEYGDTDSIEAVSGDQHVLIVNRMQDSVDRWLRDGGHRG